MKFFKRKPEVSIPQAEQDILDHILAAYQGILDLGLDCNEKELGHAVHTLQMFVMIKHLHRLEPDQWNDWYTYG